MPLISADGQQVIVISSGLLAGRTPDPEISCRVFRYDIPAGSVEQVAAFPKDHLLGHGTLSEDTRWMSFVVTRPTPFGSRALPALLDLSTGEVTDPLFELGPNDISFDSIITGDGRSIVVSGQADLDPRVGNRDRNFELFLYDREGGTFTQITETTGGVDRSPGGCEPYRPGVSSTGDVLVFSSRWRVRGPTCFTSGASQRVESNGLAYRHTRAVRIREGNERARLAPLPERISLQPGEDLALEMSAADADGDPITFFVQTLGGDDIPPGSDVVDRHDGTAVFTWRPRPQDVGEHTIRIAAFDEGGGEDLHDIRLSILPSPLDGCAGDCDGDGGVAVDEIIGLVAASGPVSFPGCSGTASAAERSEYLVSAVHHALAGCP